MTDTDLVFLLLSGAFFLPCAFASVVYLLDQRPGITKAQRKV